MLKRLLTPPAFEDEKTNRRARYLFNISLGALAFLLLLTLLRLAIAGGISAAIAQHDFISFMSMSLVALLVHIFVRRRLVMLAALTFTFGGWAAMFWQAYETGGIQDTALAVNIIVFILAALLLERSWMIYLVIMSILGNYLLALFQESGLIFPHFNTPYIAATYLSVAFLFAAFLVWHIFTDFDNLLKRARQQQEEIATARNELAILNTRLEQRVEERTEALRQESERARQRAQQLATIAEISQAIVRVQNLEQLLTHIVHQISDKLGFYHVGIFLLDERGEYAILRAANSEGGQAMLQRQHRLPVSNTSLVGYTAQTQKPRIALDVGADAIHFDNPDLPETHSEMALPLIVGGKTIGVLDIQDKETNAFSQEDITTLNTLANQVAVAIENARLFEQTRQALEQARKVYQQFIQQDWKTLRATLDIHGYRYDGAELRPLHDENRSLPDAYRQPVTLREQNIGVIEVRRRGKQQSISPNEQTLIAAAAERLAAALDNARLLDELQRRASREKLIASIGDKIIRTLSLENILDITAEELGALLPDSTINIQISPLIPEEENNGEAAA